MTGLYEPAEIVEYYVRKTDLYKPETAILERLRPELGALRMLDIGVGGGRTTRHFAPLVKDYVGVDIEPGMLEACRKGFGEEPGKRTFRLADVKDRSIFPDGAFDLVLFSMNGIDHGTQEVRRKALLEIRRVGRPKGWFCFSAHNLNYLPKLLRFRPEWRPRRLWAELGRQRRLRRLNPSPASLKGQDHAMICDGDHDYRFFVYYVRPRAQLAELASLGFTDVEVYLRDGHRATVEEAAADEESRWIYYLCRFAAPASR
jgi:SAM-dependent methyltransferase